MDKFDINEIQGHRRLRLKERKDPTMTFIGGLIIGGLVLGLIGVFVGYNLCAYGIL